MWMSEARRLTASWMIRLTSLTTGASEASSSSPPAVASVSVKSMAVSVNSDSIESTDSVSLWP